MTHDADSKTNNDMCEVSVNGSYTEEMVIKAKEIVKETAPHPPLLGNSFSFCSRDPLLERARIAMMLSIATVFEIEINQKVLKKLASCGRPKKVLSLLLFCLCLFRKCAWVSSPSSDRQKTYVLGMAFIELCKAIKCGNINVKDLTAKKGRDFYIMLTLRFDTGVCVV